MLFCACDCSATMILMLVLLLCFCCAYREKHTLWALTLMARHKSSLQLSMHTDMIAVFAAVPGEAQGRGLLGLRAGERAWWLNAKVGN